MSITATIETIVGFLDNGTGSPGLAFSDIEDDVTRITQLREGEFTDLWTVYPVTVANSSDVEEIGPHRGCLLCVTICQDQETDDPIFRFLALDPWGMPVAWHEC